ncbi:MAG: hypothetical protein QNJ41_12035 [Xenococcaceae cyanobacterium MO_188.B32]|nr:hypothetical protein [Xenococcaceae cyanobacterium MO_188.B32]
MVAVEGFARKRVERTYNVHGTPLLQSFYLRFTEIFAVESHQGFSRWMKTS